MLDVSGKKVMVAMSGGVDSSVCALLLKRSGCDVTGVTCKMFGSNVMDADEQDAWLSDVEDAKQACRRLGVEHYTFNCKDAFEKCVIQHFVDSYLSGRTPNPCVDCNRHVKFGSLQQRRAELGFDKLATGHYARTEYDESSGRWRLMRAVDRDKDQSYMLCHLSQEQLAHTVFPLGGMHKSEARALAEEAGFSSARRRESQDICFVPDGNYAGFIERWTGQESLPGPILNPSGEEIGEHSGLLHYTIGQRKGIGIGGGEPLYVIARECSRNALVAGTHSELMTRDAHADDVNFVSIAPMSAFRALAKTSYRQEPRPASVTFDGEALQVEFDEPIVRPAAGQALALYDVDSGETLLAGATLS